MKNKSNAKKSAKQVGTALRAPMYNYDLGVPKAFENAGNTLMRTVHKGVYKVWLNTRFDRRCNRLVRIIQGLATQGALVESISSYLYNGKRVVYVEYLKASQ